MCPTVQQAGTIVYSRHMASIEVEIRGNLSRGDYDRVKAFLDEHGKHMKSQEREMFLLRDYPGYSRDFVGREVDIRLRNTNGSCEIMLKKRVGNAREETQLKLHDGDLENAKKIVKALGCTETVWMHRLTEAYDHHGIEWALVIAPNDIRYYEAELAVENESEVAQAHETLEREAREIGLEVLDEEGTRALIHKLDTEANRVVRL